MLQGVFHILCEDLPLNQFSIREDSDLEEVCSKSILVYLGASYYDDYQKFYENIVKPYNEKMNYTLGGMKTNQMNIMSLIE